MLWGLLPSEGTLEGGWPSPILPSAPGCHLPPKVLGTGLGASGRGRAPQGPVPRLSGRGIYRPTEGGNKDAIVDQGRSTQSPCGSEEGWGGEGRGGGSGRELFAHKFWHCRWTASIPGEAALVVPKAWQQLTTLHQRSLGQDRATSSCPAE